MVINGELICGIYIYTIWLFIIKWSVNIHYSLESKPSVTATPSMGFKEDKLFRTPLILVLNESHLVNDGD